MGEKATRAQTSESDFSVSLNLNFHECSNYFTQQMNLYILIKYHWSYSFNETQTFSESRLNVCISSRGGNQFLR